MKMQKRLLALLIACVMAVSIAFPSMAGFSVAQNVPATNDAAQEGDGLPVAWDISSIYADADEWQADYDMVMEMLEEYDSFRGTLNNAQSIYDYFQYSSLTELTALQCRLYMYAYLGYYLNPADPVFTNLMAQLDIMDMTEGQLSAFVNPEIYSMSLEEREEIFSDPLFDGYEYWIKAYTDPDVEPLGEEANMVMSVLSLGLGYSEQVFEILNTLDVPDPMITMPDGEEVPLTEELYSEIVYSDEYSDEFKAQANQIILTRVKGFADTFAKLLEENASQAYASAYINGYDSTREASMDTYDVDPVVYDMLIEAAHEGAPDYQRYLRTHAKGLGLEEQFPYHMGTYVSDFYPGLVEYEDAVKEVTDALGIFGEEYIDTFMEIMESGHVDVYPADTKTTGAFETQISNDYLPWVLFNYAGYSEDISTIAHEMGHAVYDTFATRYQPIQYSSPTIFTQEIASTTNELLYYSYKMENAADDDEKLFYLENLLSMFSGTFFTQMWYAEFEDYIYQVVESGYSLDAEDLSDKWMELIELYRDDAIRSYPDARYQWADIPHFYYVYYVYQYASSVAYAASITERILGGEENAVEDYLAFLKLGASGSPEDLLSVAGIDPLDAETYQQALDYFSGLVDLYEELVDAKLAAE